MYNKVSIIGAGTWGIAVAQLLVDKVTVQLHHYNKISLEALNKTKKHPRISSHSISDKIIVKKDMHVDADLCIISVPVQHIRSVVESITLDKHVPVLILSKGIEKKTLMFPIDIVKQVLNVKKVGVLSGPSHAEQVLEKHPTTIVASFRSKSLSESIRSLFSNEYFRVYSNTDIIGVQLGGAAKNVISIAAGICCGLGYKENTISAIVTRGIHEIKKIGIKIGAKKNTLNGLSGTGDLIATAFSNDSRNRLYGELLGKGMTSDDANLKIGTIAEGSETADSLFSLIRKIDVEAPICVSVYKIINSNESPEKIMKNLMIRKLKNEI